METSDDASCTICLQAADEQMVVLPECSHAFHVRCIYLWINNQRSCPLCRTPFGCNVLPIQYLYAQQIIADILRANNVPFDTYRRIPASSRFEILNAMVSLGTRSQALADLASTYQQVEGSNWPHVYASVDFGLRQQGLIPPYEMSDVNAELHALNLSLPTDFVLPTAWLPTLIDQPTFNRRPPNLEFLTQARATQVPNAATPTSDEPEILLDIINLEAASTSSTDIVRSLDNYSNPDWQRPDTDERLPTRHEVNVSQNTSGSPNRSSVQRRPGENTYLPPCLWQSWYILHNHFIGANDVASAAAHAKARGDLSRFSSAAKPRDLRRQYLCYHCKSVCFGTFTIMNRHRMACPKQSKPNTNSDNV